MKQLLRLEQYTLKKPGEVLLVEADIDGEIDQVMVFKGFSSSLVRQTEFDPDIPVLPENAVIVRIDRLYSPYLPDNPRYIQQNLSWQEMQSLLNQFGI
ncbi:MAG: hypothetical protein NW224_26695 [Leptolyngbyaceae cyanobacterium bins.302]|nr:hypothetical protein [Leptolyngbyaceae cyanobacterium bins.302]